MNVLPVSTNPYISLSANYPYDGNISFNPYFQQYNNGFYFFNHDIFKKVNDLSINKYNSLFLTDKLKATEILKDKKIEREEEFSNSFLNLYMFSNLNYASVQDEDENGIQYIFADKSQVSDASVFQIVTDSVNKKIWFIYNKAYYVQVEDNPPWKLKLYFNDGAAPEDEDSYKFNYEKYEDNYVISTTYASRGVLKRYLKASPSEKYLGFYGTSLIDEGVQVGFNFLDFNFIPAVSLKGLNERSWFFSYYNKPVDFIENQTVNPNLTKSVSGVKQNFLITSPFQTKIKNLVLPEELDYKFKVSSFELNLASLKNVKNSNYEYSKLPYNLEPDENYDEIDDSDKESEFNKREYLKIFTGSNQEYGYEKPLLTYGVNNKSLSLLKDKTTFFHYPSTSPSIKLNDSGLKEAGAFPSTIPFFADKIFKKDAQYGKNVYWGDSTQFQNGQWLCSWLSGNGDTSVWMDRWYLPDQITTFAALTAFLPEPISCGINYANFNNVKVFDVESIMTFEPEVWYKYFHIGENFIQYAVDNIINYNKNYLKLHYENWNSSSIKDESESNPDGQYINFTNSSNFMINGRTQNIADLNGLNQYIFIPYSEKVKVENNNTFSIWAYSENWSEVKYSDIVSNGSSNYYNLKISNGLENPISVIYAKDQNKLIFFNNDNIIYAYVDLINENNLSNVENVCVDNKLNVWVLDKGLNFIYKISYSGVIELKIEFPVSFNLSNITLNSKSEVNVVNKNTGILSSIDLNGNVYTQNTNYIGDDFRIESSLNDAISGFECYKFLFDSNDYPWILSTDRKTLNRFETPVLIAEYEIDDFTIDNLNNIWVLFDNNKIYKLDSIGLLSLSATIPLDNTNAPKGGITILNDYSSKTQKDENFILVSKNKFFYKYDNNLNYIKKYNTGVVPYETNYITPNTDWSGYDFGRKYIYLKDFNGVTNLQLSYSLFNNQLGVLDYKLFYPANKLNKGWHNFCGVYDNNEKTIKFYIDGELENRIINIPYDTIMNINLKNPTLLGNKMGLIVSFNEEITLKNKFIFKGKIDDFRVYNKSLSDLEVKLLYYLKLKFYDLKWHIPTGFQIYVEEIERFFKHKLTGSKSNLYNINIINYKTEDESVKRQIEEIIKETVVKIAPAYTQLYKINWTDEK